LSDLLDRIRDDINGRLSELRPMIEEYHRLEKASEALNLGGGTPSSAKAAGSGRGGARARIRSRVTMPASTRPLPGAAPRPPA
jgi:hypothetical protein